MRILIGDVPIDAVTFEGALDAIERLVGAGQGGSVFTPNLDHVVKVDRDPAAREAYAAVSLSLADGMPLVWASKLLRTPVPEKVSGSDLLPPLMKRAARKGWRVYLLGARPEVASAAAEKLRSEGVIIAGIDSPVVRSDGGAGEDVVERVRGAKPNLLIVALGFPKQERFIHRYGAELRPAVALGMGASLDFVAGAVRRAPRWMQRSGLEWLFRLAQEPRRMARRYLIEDPRFALILLRALRTPREKRILSAAPAAPAR
jgi:N-acetylglucosaminyldiphosphoundecaprenol N-acetyl-beta-D-mannosaminyltransferase